LDHRHHVQGVVEFAIAGPARDSRWRTTWPLEASGGAVPVWAAKWCLLGNRRTSPTSPRNLAASFTVAGRNNGFAKADARAATRAAVAAYREAMAGFTQMGTMAIWYAQLDEDQVMAVVALEGL
jgi:Uncharacterized protein conserved in bacteria (DUF2252)